MILITSSNLYQQKIQSLLENISKQRLLLKNSKNSFVKYIILFDKIWIIFFKIKKYIDILKIIIYFKSLISSTKCNFLFKIVKRLLVIIRLILKLKKFL